MMPLQERLTGYLHLITSPSITILAVLYLLGSLNLIFLLKLFTDSHGDPFPPGETQNSCQYFVNP